MQARSNRDCFGCPEVSTCARNARPVWSKAPWIRDRQIRRICVASVPLRRLNFLGSFQAQGSRSSSLIRESRPRTRGSSSCHVSHLCPSFLSLSLSSSLSLAHPWDYKNGSVIFTHPIIEGPSPIYGNRAAWSGRTGPTPAVQGFQKLQNLRSNLRSRNPEQKLNFFPKSEAGCAKRRSKSHAV